MAERRMLLAAAIAVLLGCGSEPTHADDQKPDEKQPVPAEKKDEKAGDKKDDKAAEKKERRKFKAHITDRIADVQPYDIDDAEIQIPVTSLFGGASFENKVVLNVKSGAAEIEIPFEQIRKVECNDVKEDRLDVVVHLKGQNESESIKGTVKSNLILHGKFRTNLDATLKLREIKAFELTEDVKAPPK